jgi:hypothetical protein
VFDVGLDAPVNKGFFKLLKAADGSEIFLITGALRVSFTNLQTGKTITENVSGPEHITANPDGSATVVSRGRGFTALTPEDAGPRPAHRIRVRGRADGTVRPRRDRYLGVPAGRRSGGRVRRVELGELPFLWSRPFPRSRLRDG